uniref:GH16 domain-containing protein n=1 Tax=Haptolina brevifila TaxID=156173 RepID=A0A7S2G998_9EUKA
MTRRRYNGLSFGPPVPGISTGGFANNGWYGPPWGADCPTGCPDALSGGFVELNDLDSRYWTYTMEWKTGPNGHLSWYYDGHFVWAMAAEAFGEYSVCADRGGVKECTRTPKRQIPEEPMSIVMNTAIGTWNGGKTALDGKHWPAKFFVDYVRVYQDVENVGCDPPNYPTATYIDKHASWYGEPALPRGSETCPSKYPPSAHAHAAAIKAAAVVERSLRAEQNLATAATALRKDAAKKVSSVLAGAPHALSAAATLERGTAIHLALNPTSAAKQVSDVHSGLFAGAWFAQPTTAAAAAATTTAGSGGQQLSAGFGVAGGLALVAIGAVGAFATVLATRRFSERSAAQATLEAEEELRSAYDSTYQAYERMEGLR